MSDLLDEIVETDETLTRPVSVTLQISILNKLDKEAEVNNKTRSKMLMSILEEYYRNEGGEPLDLRTLRHLIESAREEVSKLQRSSN